MAGFRSWVIVSGALLGAAAGPARAAPLEGWVVDVGGRVGASPDYEGSDKTKVTVSPTLGVRRANPEHRFTPPDPGATLTLLDSRRFSAGPVLLLRRARDDDGELAGLRRIKRAVEVGAFVDIWPADWLRLHVQGRRGVRGHKGWVGDAGFDLIYAAPKWDASLGPRVGYASARYMETYFGVTPEEAARNPVIAQAYAPSGGARYLGGRAAFQYYLSDRWRAGVDAGYQRLGHKGADSPIVQAFGSRDQVSAGVSVAYSFGLPFGRK